MTNVVVAFLVVQDGADNAASCEGLRMASMHGIQLFGGHDASKVSIKVELT